MTGQRLSRLSTQEIQDLLQPYIAASPPGERAPDRPELYEQVSVYLDLLMRWNARTNLTSIRDEKGIVQRHFGESFFAARHLKAKGTLLDLGSGAGFPGIPIQLWHPELDVTLAESQGKKAAFLREVVRTLSLPTEVWAGRAEDLAAGRTFRNVVMRAVDRTGEALQVASDRAELGIWVLGSTGLVAQLGAGVRQTLELVEQVQVPDSAASYLFRLRQAIVPRGTQN